jgi:hypothetical protein
MGGGVFFVDAARRSRNNSAECAGLPVLISFSHDLPPDSAGQI